MKLKEPWLTIFYIIVGIAVAFAINQSLAFILKTDMPIVAVESNSMVPTFYKGDVLILQGVSPEQLKIGDIIVFFPTGQNIPIVHRIIAINSDGTFQTKGDANAGQLQFEKAIKSEQIHGKMIAIIPFIGWIKIGLTEFIIPNIIWIIAVIVLAWVINRAIKRFKSPTTIKYKHK
jgi:signal peptidase